MSKTSQRKTDKSIPANMDEARFNGIRLIPLRPGLADVNHQSSGHLLALNLSSLSTQVALGSDQMRPRSNRPGELLWLPSGVDFRQRGTSDQPGLLISIDRSAATRMFEVDELRAAKATIPTYVNDRQALTIGKRLIEVLSQAHPDEGETEMLGLNLLGLAGTRIGLTAPRAMTGEETRVQKAMDYVQDQISNNDLSLADIAKEVDISAVHLGRLFQAHIGHSAWDWILYTRTRLARRLLMSTHRPLAEIALDCGFYDQAHMTKVVKKWLGTTPAKIRRSATL